MHSKERNENTINVNMKERPKFPKRAVITAGMPYGNKKLHFGHLGGLFVHADVYARFMRDRIGKDNVIFVSGTDCYGSPMEVSYAQSLAEGSTKSLETYVTDHHVHQKATLEAFNIIPELYATSAFGRAGEIHASLSHDVFNKLKKLGLLVELSKAQFFDEASGKFLNGRQVRGKCPVHGCKSEKAYADECDLGHSYMPSDLIDPKSIVTGERPILKSARNWYFKLDAYNKTLESRMAFLKDERKTRPYVIKEIEEFLKAPVIHLKRKDYESDTYTNFVNGKLPKHTLTDNGKHAVILNFESLTQREEACKVLDATDIYYRTGKTLVPFRLTGNSSWGISVPEAKDLTFWCWPESLWAPISFTKTYLESKGKGPETWKDWWNHDESEVYQFIGEDNIYFYGVAEMGLFPALDGYLPDSEIDWTTYKLPYLVANKHILYMNNKASSSGLTKPPLAHELLEHYTAEQLRIHFLSLGLSRKSVSFSPMVYAPNGESTGNDPVLKDGNLLTNIFNRLARSCFYTAQTYNNSKIPDCLPSDLVYELSCQAVIEYERFMVDHEFHRLVYVLDAYLRKMNKHWAKNMKEADARGNEDLRLLTLADGFHVLKTALTLLHPIAPVGCEKIADHLNMGGLLWDWDIVFDPLTSFLDVNSHELKHLEPKSDFFKKHPSQYKKKDPNE